MRDETGKTYAIELGGYFENVQGEIEEWIFNSAPEQVKNKYPKFKIPLFHRTLSQWVNMLVRTGYVIEAMEEPHPNDEVVAQYPGLQDAQVVAYFLIIRCRKRE